MPPSRAQLLVEPQSSTAPPHLCPRHLRMLSSPVASSPLGMLSRLDSNPSRYRKHRLQPSEVKARHRRCQAETRAPTRDAGLLQHAIGWTSWPRSEMHRVPFPADQPLNGGVPGLTSATHPPRRRGAGMCILHGVAGSVGISYIKDGRRRTVMVVTVPMVAKWNCLSAAAQLWTHGSGSNHLQGVELISPRQRYKAAE